MKTIQEDLAKELALVTAFIIHSDLLGGTIFGTFDKAYEIAHLFVEKYPLNTMWGIGEGLLEFDDEIYRFTGGYLKNLKE